MNDTFALNFSTDVWKDVVNEREGGSDSDLRTFENNSLPWRPGVTESSCILTRVEKYTTRLVGENTDLRTLEIVDWVGFEIVHVCSPKYGKIREFVEVRVLLESQTSLVVETAKVPKNFVYV